MKTLKVGLSVVLFIVVLAYTLAFAAQNSLLVELNFLLGSPVTLPLSLWLGVVLLLGAIVGVFSGVVINARQKLQLRQLRKELADTKQRLNKLP
ncbi:MAG: lipopolysaccharide assembly protein LapA domain-containing protein [Saccharospirillaceae bacterium]|nr:lipopolysaccharide assembly protein LapA domain-containing protein [Saccharospirillaceae bacterium]MCD8532308.1 lipopolysaccharide assembly protein LapA domain-containing protein [Saccharospirillaceae bacterium]